MHQPMLSCAFAPFLVVKSGFSCSCLEGLNKACNCEGIPELGFVSNETIEVMATQLGFSLHVFVWYLPQGY